MRLSDMSWLSDDALLVRLDARARVFEAAPGVAGVTLTYEAVER